MSIVCLLTVLSLAGFSQVQFKQRFNPEAGLVRAAEHPYRTGLCLNGKWQIMPVYSKDTSNTAIPAAFNWDKTPVKIPSAWNVNGFPGRDIVDFNAYPSYPKKWERADQAWLKTEFTVPEGSRADRLLLHFESVAGRAIYYLNGEKVGENFDIFFPYEMDVTDKVRRGQKNELLVLVQGSRLFDQQGKYGRRTYVSGSFWGTFINGIWQDVYLFSKPSVSIADLFIHPKLDQHTLQVEVTLENKSGKEQTVSLDGTVHQWLPSGAKDVISAPVQTEAFNPKTLLDIKSGRAVVLAPGEKKTVQLSTPVKPGTLSPWTPDHPNLQVLLMGLKVNGKKTDQKYQRFGWRQFLFKGSEMTLNGAVIHLKGDSWHFMGVPQMTRRYAWGWYKMLKDAHSNAVRLHAEPFPSFYLDMADEMGICVLDESAIWASDGGPNYGSADYWANCKVHLDHLVRRDRNHAAVFGWSVCNEVIPVARNVFHMPDSLVEGIVTEINSWVKEVKALDPTRPWISGDGETDVPTQLPTTVGHYGGEESMQKWATKGLPWGIGEQSMAYYGTPKQVAAIGGPRAYESQEGRMEGLATEAYRLLKTQRELHATYSSVFNIIWYGLKPLTLGMKDSTRQATIRDGVFFTHYKEGEPGMQPERLGPYTTTLNPGYDPRLPLYDPWPFFDAIRDANSINEAAGPTAENTLDQKWLHPNWHHEEIPVTAKARTVYYLSDAQYPLYKELKNLGLQVADQKNLASDLDNTALIVLDGMHLPGDSSRIQKINQAVAGGADLVILGVNAGNLAALNQLMPARVALTKRSASSLVVSNRDPALSGLDNSDFYFSEISKKPVMTSGLTGPAVEKGKVLLSACQTDWNTWNGQPEYMKTAAVLKSEREAKPSGAVFIKEAQGKGAVYLWGCDITGTGGALNEPLQRILRNLGAGFGQKGQAGNLPLTREGQLQAALYCSRYNNSTVTPRQLLDKDFMSTDQLKNAALGQTVTGHQWRAGFVAESGYVFDLKKLAATGPEDNAVGYLSFWVYSPRSLRNLLVEPDIPAVSLNLDTKDALTVRLNDKEVLRRLSTTDDAVCKVNNLPLNKGWNHVLIKSIHGTGDWQIGVSFTSDHPAFLGQMHTAFQQ